MNYNFIAIEGNIGSGKTSLASQIASDFKSELILESFSDNPFLPKFYKDPEKYSFSLELFFMSERYHQLKDKISSDLFFNNKISDYFFMKSRIFAKTNLQRDELLLFEKLFDIMLASLPAPDLLVYLHSDIKRLQANIRKRGREYEQNIKDSYLESIQDSYFDYLKKQNKSAVLIIDITDVDFVNDLNTYSEIKRLISKKHTVGSTEKIIL
jgi:deoxyadenosine/deoxycytidine kinase